MKIIDLSKPRKRLSVTMLSAAAVFFISLVITGITAGILAILVSNNLITVNTPQDSIESLNKLLLYMFLISMFFGVIIAFVCGQLITRPVNKLINAMNALAAGIYTTRIQSKSVLGKLSAVKELMKSFNTLAQELEGTEMLRSDFVNNFSHEFKTPIVSIAGFAQLLRQENLDEHEREEYLAIIEDESRRLSKMATNVLTLNKLEQQTILTDIATFNLAEQVRTCVLLLEDKWTKKELDINLNFDEVSYTGNEELLRQVWINIIDNAVKFSPDGGTISLDILETPDVLNVTITNTGSYISEEDRSRVFQKFYQADSSHTVQGNGIGLAVAARIIALHEGTITIESTDGEDAQHQLSARTSFIIKLPR